MSTMMQIELKFDRRSFGAPLVVSEAAWLFWIVLRPESAKLKTTKKRKSCKNEM